MSHTMINNETCCIIGTKESYLELTREGHLKTSNDNTVQTRLSFFDTN